MPIQIAAGFFLLRVFEFAPMFGLAVGKPISLRKLLAVAALGLFPDGSKIDQLGHTKSPSGTDYVAANTPTWLQNAVGDNSGQRIPRLCW